MNWTYSDAGFYSGQTSYLNVKDENMRFLLTLKTLSLETTFSLYMPLMHQISFSVQALSPNLHLTPVLALISRLMTLTILTR